MIPGLKNLNSNNVLLLVGGGVLGVLAASFIMKQATPTLSMPDKYAMTGAGKPFPHTAYLNTLPTQINYPPSTDLVYRIQTLNGLADMWQYGTFGPPLNP